MTSWSRHRLGPQDRRPLRLIWRFAVGLVVAAGVLGLSRGFSEDQPGGSAARPDRGTPDRSMMVKISAAPGGSDVDEVQAPPRPPVKEQAERKGVYPSVLSPRRDLTGVKRSAPAVRPASPTRIQPPSALDAVPVFPSSARENGLDQESQALERVGGAPRVQQPQGIVQEAREEMPLVARGPGSELRERAPEEDGPSLATKPMLRVSVDRSRVWRVPIGDESTPVPTPSESERSRPPDSASAPVLLPRPPAFADEPPAQGSPTEASAIETSPAQEPPAEMPVARQQGLSLAERIQKLRESDTPPEPDGEVAQATDSGADAASGAAAPEPEVNRSTVERADLPWVARQPGRIDISLTPSQPNRAGVGETVKVLIGPPGEAQVGDKPAAGSSASAGPDASLTVIKGSSSPAATAAASPSPATPGARPNHLSLRFPRSQSAPVPKSLRVTKPSPQGAGQPLTPGLAAANRPGKEPVIVARLGTGATSGGKTSSAAMDVQFKGKNDAASPVLKPIRLSIKGSTVTVQSGGGDTSPEKADATPAKPKEDTKAGAGESSVQQKSAAAGPSPTAPAGQSTRAAARLRQWSLLDAQRVLPPASDGGNPTRLGTAQRSTASLR